MRVLVYYAHPVETSFVAALHERVVSTLRRGGHEVDDCDLNAEGFDPVLSRAERLAYHDVAANVAPVADQVARLRRAEALVLVFPVWNFGFPAILKGVFDRVFLPGVSFHMEGQTFVPALRRVRRLSAVCTYGADRWRAFAAGDPPRRCVTRMLRHLIEPKAPCDYLACYNMNHTTLPKREAFLARVTRHFDAWPA